MKADRLRGDRQASSSATRLPRPKPTSSAGTRTDQMLGFLGTRIMAVERAWPRMRFKTYRTQSQYFANRIERFFAMINEII